MKIKTKGHPMMSSHRRPQLGSILRRSQGGGRFNNGFTVIELIVSISVVVLLMSLLLPAIQRSREASRALECRNNLRGLTMAMTQFESAHRRLPYAAVTDVSNVPQPQPRVNWVISLLPCLDHADVFEEIDFKLTLLHPENLGIIKTQLPVLACPSDTTTLGAGDLSYALNGGFGSHVYAGSGTALNAAVMIHQGGLLDLDGDGVFRYTIANTSRSAQDRRLLHATGVFRSVSTGLLPSVAAVVPDQMPSKVGFVNDGLSNTMWIAENLNTGCDAIDPAQGWATTDHSRVFVAINPDVCWGGSCSRSNVDLGLANSLTGRINGGRSIAEGRSPYPSSEHDGGVNVSFGDGSVRFISDRIDGIAYFDLFTPQSSVLKGTPLDSSLVR